jgi:hypothetical protein
MQMTSKLTLVLAAAGLFAVTACSSAVKRDSGFEDPNAPKPDDNGATPAPGSSGTPGAPGFGDTDGGGGGGTAVCAPSPGNFEVPNNGCDDDGDGTVDNATAACDTGLAVNGDAAAFVKALGVCQASSGASDPKWGVITATYTKGYNQTAAPADGQHGLLGKFGNTIKPREGGTLGILSTGWAREFDGSSGTSQFKGGTSMTGSGAVPPGYPKAATGCSVASDVHDVAAVKLSIKVPDNAQGIAFDFNFHSGEWPEFVCTSYNDGFIAYLKSSAFNGGTAENISFDAQNNPVSVNNGFFDHCTPNTQTGCSGGGIFGGGTLKTAVCAGGESELAGTGFESKGKYCANKLSTGGGATGWLTSQAPVKPGEIITLEFMIWDTGDANYDSSVLLDHLTWSPTPTITKTDRPK